MKTARLFSVVMLVLVLGVGTVAFAADKAPETPAKLKAPEAAAGESAPEAPDMAKVSYSIGANMGKNFKDKGVDLDRKQFVQGMNDALEGKPLTITDEEMQKVMTDFSKVMAAKQQAEMQKKGDENKAAEVAFMEENAKKAGVVTLPSGLEYKVIKEGTGPMPKATDKVKVNYVGTLPDGTEFDSSIKRGKPAEFPVTGVIKGWTEALQLMKVGSEWELYVPATLGYGPRGTGGQGPGIGPNQMLIFKVELLEILPATEAPAPGAAPSVTPQGAAPKAEAK